MTVSIKTTLIAVITLIFLGITSHNDTLIASSLTSSDERYDAKGIWLGGQENDDEFLEGLRQCIAMNWGGLKDSEGTPTFTLTEAEKRNPGGGSVVVKFGTMGFSIRFNGMHNIREEVSSRLLLIRNIKLRQSISKERLLNAVNAWNSWQVFGWTAFVTDDPQEIQFKSCMYLTEDYLSWDELMQKIKAHCLNKDLVIGFGIADPEKYGDLDLFKIFKDE